MKSKIRKVFFTSGIVRTSVLVLVLFYTLATDLFAQSPAELYTQANQFYQSKQFTQAAEDYEKLIAQGYKRTEVYFNLGNCYYKLDSVGKCVLNYERALKLSPKDEDIIYNLKLAEQKSVDNIQAVPQLAIVTWWNNFLSYNSSTGWSIVAVASLWVALLLFAVYLFISRLRVFNLLALLFLIASFVSLALAVNQQHQQENSDAAIVMVPNSFIKSAPDASANDLFMLHEGTRIQILDRVGEWNKIRLDDGKVGWVEQGKFERI